MADLPNDLQSLEQRIGHVFHDVTILQDALTHRSFSHEHGGVKNNERLEFLGDAVLDLFVAEMLMKAHPDLAEGQLSTMRSRLVNEAKLAEVASLLCLQDFLRLGVGEERSGGRQKPSLLADALEALLAAVYVDGGFTAAQTLVNRWFADAIPSSSSAPIDFKSHLQELTQRLKKGMPVYTTTAERGPPHQREFEVQVTVEGVHMAVAVGRSKKLAEQKAAELAILALGKTA